MNLMSDYEHHKRDEEFDAAEDRRKQRKFGQESSKSDLGKSPTETGAARTCLTSGPALPNSSVDAEERAGIAGENLCGSNLSAGLAQDTSISTTTHGQVGAMDSHPTTTNIPAGIAAKSLASSPSEPASVRSNAYYGHCPKCGERLGFGHLPEKCTATCYARVGETVCGYPKISPVHFHRDVFGAHSYVGEPVPPTAPTVTYIAHKDDCPLIAKHPLDAVCFSCGAIAKYGYPVVPPTAPMPTNWIPTNLDIVKELRYAATWEGRLTRKTVLLDAALRIEALSLRLDLAETAARAETAQLDAAALAREIYEMIDPPQDEIEAIIRKHITP